MKIVRVNILGNGFSNFRVKTEGNDIVIDTFDEKGDNDMWLLSKYLTNAGKIEGFGTQNIEDGSTRFILTMSNGFMGIIEGTTILKNFDATELLTRKS